MVPNWGHAPLIGSSKTHKPIRDSQIVYMTSEAWVSGSEPFSITTVEALIEAECLLTQRGACVLTEGA